MRKTTINAILFIALIALVAVASAELPDTVTATIEHPGALLSSYWTVEIQSGGNTDLQNSPPLYVGWCADSQKYIGNPHTGTFDVYSSMSSNPSPISPANWKKINYVINHKPLFALNKYELQALIWKYDGGKPKEGWWGSIDEDKVNAAMKITDDYIAANPTYTPSPGEVYSVVLWSGENAQTIFIEVPIPYTSPEFPSLALPVAMLLGLVFTVYSIKKRED
jgi:hypothetical protein